MTYEELSSFNEDSYTRHKRQDDACYSDFFEDLNKEIVIEMILGSMWRFNQLECNITDLEIYAAYPNDPPVNTNYTIDTNAYYLRVLGLELIDYCKFYIRFQSRFIIN